MQQGHETVAPDPAQVSAIIPTCAMPGIDKTYHQTTTAPCPMPGSNIQNTSCDNPQPNTTPSALQNSLRSTWPRMQSHGESARAQGVYTSSGVLWCMTLDWTMWWLWYQLPNISRHALSQLTSNGIVIATDAITITTYQRARQLLS